MLLGSNEFCLAAAAYAGRTPGRGGSGRNRFGGLSRTRPEGGHGNVNRAVMLRVAACGVIGLGAALLIAALLLWTYTSSRITKIPLDIDATLISDGTGTALDSASLSGDHLVVNQNVPLVSQQQVSVESPANADVVTLQVGSSVRRTDKQKDSGLVLAIVDTVTLNRRTAIAVSDDTHTGGSVQKPRSFGDENPPTAISLRHDGLSYRFPFHTEKKK